METLTFKATIGAPKQKVWDTMLKHGTYEEWVSASWPNSGYEGEWLPGREIKFIGPDGSGTLAKINSLTPYSEIVAEHVAILLKGGIADRYSDAAKSWVGTIEQYNFTETNDATELVITMKTQPEWKEMFAEGWPNALAKLKEVCER